MKVHVAFQILTIILFSSITGKAQIELTVSDLPNIDEVHVTTIVDSIMGDTLQPGLSGENVTWDFSWLQFCCIDNAFQRWVNSEYTANHSFFPGADVALKTNCYLYHDWETHVVTEICSNYNYYIKDTTGLLFYGSDYPIPYTGQMYRNVFPLLQYGETIVNKSRYVVQISQDSMTVTNITDTMIADGWGTIITPLGQYNAIRIHTLESVTDSLFVNGIIANVNSMPQNYYYKWYAKDLGFPVMQISKGIFETNPDYQIVRVAKDKWTETGIDEHVNTNKIILVYPNPANEETEILFTLTSKKDVTIELINTLGMEIGKKYFVLPEGEQRIKLNEIVKINNLKSGLYFIVISTNNETIIQKVVR